MDGAYNDEYGASLSKELTEGKTFTLCFRKDTTYVATLTFTPSETQAYTCDFTELVSNDEITYYGNATDIIKIDEYTTAYLTFDGTYVTADGKVYLKGDTTTNTAEKVFKNSYIAFTAPSDGTVTVSGSAMGFVIDTTYKGYTDTTYTMAKGQTLYIGYRSSSTYVSTLRFVSGTVTSKSIDLTKGNITMNVYVDSSVYSSVSSTIGGVDSTDKLSVTSDEDNSQYIISQNILATQMADEIVYTITLTDGSTITYTTSVKDYAAEVLAMSGTTDEQKAVLNAMLDYGSAVQTLASYNTSNLANGGEYQSGVTSVDATEIAGVVSKKTTPSGGTGWSGPKLSSMNMNFNYNFNLGMTYDNSLDGYAVTVKLGNNTYNVSASAGETSDSSSDKVVFSSDKKSIIIKNLSTADLYSDLTVTLTPSASAASDEDSSTETVTSYTTATKPLYYARLLLDSTSKTVSGATNTISDQQKKLGQTLYLYAKAVNDLQS